MSKSRNPLTRAPAPHIDACRYIGDDATVCGARAGEGRFCEEHSKSLAARTQTPEPYEDYGELNEDLRDLLLDIVDGYSAAADRARLTESDTDVPGALIYGLATVCDTTREVYDVVSDVRRGLIEVGNKAYGMCYAKDVKHALINHFEDRDTVTAALVGCSGSKQDLDAGETVPARDLYTSSYWTCKRRYGETVADDWRICSAEHAVLDPDAETGYYERTPDDLEGVPVQSDALLPNGDEVSDLLDQWALRVHEETAAWVSELATSDSPSGIDPRTVTVSVILGAAYADRLRERDVFDSITRETLGTRVEFTFPFQAHDFSGMGDQMEWLNEQSAAAETDETGGV